MDTGTNVKRLVKIDELIKRGLGDEVIIIKSIYLELADNLKQVKELISQVRFEDITKNSSEKILKPSRDAINSFISGLAPLERLEGRFYNISEQAVSMKKKLEEMKNTLGVYGSAKKAAIDFENNIIYEFKVTIQREFEQDIEFNKKLDSELS
ncbi:hypothetical protein GOV06_05000 [Candidatus Woesearchaeota archaeon]|nr:hypothetical protein [Candidatus Woesearchaeota archaeon]